MNIECALKLTDLWITSLLFDLNHKFIDGSFAFSPGLIYILVYKPQALSSDIKATGRGLLTGYRWDT